MSQVSAYEITIPKTIDNLRASAYHKQLGLKIWASFLAQQQGIRVDSALRQSDDENVGDLWLVLAELAREGVLGEQNIAVRHCE